MSDIENKTAEERVGVEEMPVEFFASGNLTEFTDRDLRWKSWTWGRIEIGDCVCRDAELTLYSDGLAYFSAYTSTSDSGDVWLFKGLALLDSNGFELYRIPQFNGPRMEVEGFQYFIIRARDSKPLIFPQQIWGLVHGVTMYYHC